MTEEELASLFERAVQDLDPAVHAIVTEAERRGRRLRVRRRGYLAASGTFVAGLTASALVAWVPLGGSGGGLAATGSAGHHTATKHGKHAKHPKHPARSASPSPSRSVWTPPPKLAPRFEMRPKKMLHVLKGLLPAGSTLGYVNPYATGPGNVEVDYNDGLGAVDLQLTVEPSAYFAPLACPKKLWKNEGPRPRGALPISCAMRTLPDGSIERDAVYYADAYGFYAYSVYVQRPDGVTVDLEVGNGIIHSLPQVDRARPPGSMAEWRAIAENPVWHLKKGWHFRNASPNATPSLSPNATPSLSPSATPSPSPGG